MSPPTTSVRESVIYEAKNNEDCQDPFLVLGLMSELIHQFFGIGQARLSLIALSRGYAMKVQKVQKVNSDVLENMFRMISSERFPRKRDEVTDLVAPLSGK